MTSPAIKATGLSKRFGSTTAVTDLDLSVPSGTVLALLGPNGSGKTTTVRMLATLLRPTSGAAHLLGLDVRARAGEIRRLIGVTGQFSAVDDGLTGRENLLFIARLLGHRRAQAQRTSNDLLDAFDLTEAADRPARDYSGGMRRRLDVAASLIGQPRILFLDEPTTGLDPIARERLWEIIRSRVARGCTVLLTTQYLEEADQLADSVVIIDHGRQAAVGTPAELKALAGDPELCLQARHGCDVSRLAALLHRVAGEEPAAPENGLVGVHMPAHRVAEVIRAVDDAGIEVEAISLREPDLDDVFRQLTERTARP